jgi:hypothetical protein
MEVKSVTQKSKGSAPVVGSWQLHYEFITAKTWQMHYEFITARTYLCALSLFKFILIREHFKMSNSFRYTMLSDQLFARNPNVQPTISILFMISKSNICISRK